MAAVFKAGFWQEAFRLHEDEEVQWWCGARRVERWAARGGRLILTNQRLAFRPSNFEKRFVRRWPDGATDGSPFNTVPVDSAWTAEVEDVEEVYLTAREVSFRGVVAWNWGAGIWISQRDGDPCALIVRSREETVSGLRAALGLAGPATRRPATNGPPNALGEES